VNSLSSLKAIGILVAFFILTHIAAWDHWTTSRDLYWTEKIATAPAETTIVRDTIRIPIRVGSSVGSATRPDPRVPGFLAAIDSLATVAEQIDSMKATIRILSSPDSIRIPLSRDGFVDVKKIPLDPIPWSFIVQEAPMIIETVTVEKQILISPGIAEIWPWAAGAAVVTSLAWIVAQK